MHKALKSIFNTSLSYLPPGERISTANFAAKYRFLNNTGGGHQGLWSNTVAPYTVEIMGAFDDPEVSCVSVVGPGQSSKTALAENFLMKTIMNEPQGFLWYAQTGDSISSFVKNRIDPLIEDHPAVLARLGKRPIDNSMSFKKFAGMRTEFLTATRSALISKSAPRIVADEIDSYPAELGDVKIQLDIRRQTFAQSKLILISHPDMAGGLHPEQWSAGIMSTYKDSDRCVWVWPCPRCSKWSSPNPGTPWHMGLSYPQTVDVANPVTLEQVESDARLICPHCEGEIEDHERREMNAKGHWVSSFQDLDQDTGAALGEAPTGKNRGFWITGSMSPFVFDGLGGLAKALAKAELEAEKTGDLTSLKEIHTKMLGFPFRAPSGMRGSIDANTLAERASHNRFPKGTVHESVRFLITSVDVQANRFEFMVRGFCENGESYIVDVDAISCDPTRDEKAWDHILKLYAREYPLRDGSGRKMKVRGLVFDSQGAPGVTESVYTQWKAWKLAGIARRRGSNAGKDVWNLIPYRGLGGLTVPPLRVSYPEQQKKSRVQSAGVVPLLLVNTNTYKDALAGALEREAGPHAIHFPHWMCSREPPHKLFEQIVNSEVRLPTGKWAKAQHGGRNELLDLLVMGSACFHLNWGNMIDWKKPPAWARAIDDDNSMIIMPEISPDGMPAQENKHKTTLERLMLL